MPVEERELEQHRTVGDRRIGTTSDEAPVSALMMLRYCVDDLHRRKLRVAGCDRARRGKVCAASHRRRTRRRARCPVVLHRRLHARDRKRSHPTAGSRRGREMASTLMLTRTSEEALAVLSQQHISHLLLGDEPETPNGSMKVRYRVVADVLPRPLVRCSARAPSGRRPRAVRRP